jgi:hypothetical protein
MSNVMPRASNLSSGRCPHVFGLSYECLSDKRSFIVTDPGVDGRYSRIDASRTGPATEAANLGHTQANGHQ